MEQNKSNDFEMKAPVMPTVAMGIKEESFSAGTIEESNLSDADRSRVVEFANALDITDVDQVINYGAPAQKNISSFSASILDSVRTTDLGEIGDALRDLTVVLNDSVTPGRKGVRRLFRKAKKSFDLVRANYSKAETNVNRIERDLKTHQDILSRDIGMYQRMFDLNLQYYRDLTVYIIAGKRALARIRETKLAEMKKNADQTQRTEDVQAFRDLEDLCNRFEKKISDLELTRLIAIQTAPQIRLLQNNDREMLDKIQSSLSNTIPLWRNQLVLSLGIEHSQRAIEAQRYLTNKTNELLIQNAETLRMAAVGVAEEAERSIVDIETLEKCNAELIASITEVVRIHEQGILRRKETRNTLVRLEGELKETLCETKLNGS